MNQCFFGDTNSLASDCASAMSAMTIYIKGTSSITITSTRRGNCHVKKRDGASFKFTMRSPDPGVQHINMGIRTSDTKIVITPVKANFVIKAINAPEIGTHILCQPSLGLCPATQTRSLHRDYFFRKKGTIMLFQALLQVTFGTL